MESMSEIIIQKGPKLSVTQLQELDEIFFESSTKKDFKDAAEKEAFKWKYLGFYLTHYPELLFVALKDEKLLGYCLGTPVSLRSDLIQIQPHLETFGQYLSIYPGHLHINCHSALRGQGIGSKLISEFIKSLKLLGLPGCHIMTGPYSMNRAFYSRLGFNEEVILAYQGTNILMMGMRF